MILHDTLAFKAIHYHSLSVRMLEGRNFDHSTLWVMLLSLSAIHILSTNGFPCVWSTNQPCIDGVDAVANAPL